MATYHSSQKLSKFDEPDTAGEVGTNSQVTYSGGPFRMDKQRQDDHLEPTYNSSVPIHKLALKTYWKWWTIEKGGRRGSGRSVLMVRHDDKKSLNYVQTNELLLLLKKGYLKTICLQILCINSIWH